MFTKMSKHLTEEQFNKAADRGRKMNAATLKWARAVLVEGRRVTDVAAESVVSKQRVSQACKQIHTRYAAVTEQEKWRSVCGVLPLPLADRFDALQDDISRFLKKQR
jgi:CHASE3 domain sensor protein